MAKDFNAFLKQNVQAVENEKYVASKRIKDENGNPVAWEIRALTSEEDELIRRECTKRVKVPGKRGQYMTDTDGNMYIAKIAAACTVYPNLLDAQTQDSYGVKTPEALLQAILLPGEYADYVEKIQEINGYETDDEDLVNEVKNS